MSETSGPHDVGGQEGGPVDLSEHDTAHWEWQIDAMVRLALGKGLISDFAELRDGIDTSRVIFELIGPWIPGTHHCDVYDLKKFLITEFGPDVNLANVMPEHVWETEALRVGLSVTGPSALAEATAAAAE